VTIGSRSKCDKCKYTSNLEKSKVISSKSLGTSNTGFAWQVLILSGVLACSLLLYGCLDPSRFSCGFWSFKSILGENGQPRRLLAPIGLKCARAATILWLLAVCSGPVTILWLLGSRGGYDATFLWLLCFRVAMPLQSRSSWAPDAAQPQTCSCLSNIHYWLPFVAILELYLCCCYFRVISLLLLF
jgi:hypothetical protein